MTMLEHGLRALAGALLEVEDLEQGQLAQVMGAAVTPEAWEALCGAAAALREALEGEDVATLLAAAPRLLAALEQAAGGANDPARAASRALAYVVWRHLRCWSPAAAAALELLGVLEVPPQDDEEGGGEDGGGDDGGAGGGDAAVPLEGALVVPELRLDRAALALRGPRAWLEGVYRLGGALEFELLARRLLALLRHLGLEAGLFDHPRWREGSGYAPRQLRVVLARGGLFPESYGEVGIGLAPAPAALLLSLYATGGLSGQLYATESMELVLDAKDLTAGATLVLGLEGGAQLAPGLAPEDEALAGAATLRLAHRAGLRTEWLRAAGLEVSSSGEALELTLGERAGEPGFGVALRTDGLVVRFDPAAMPAAGFLAKVVARPVELSLALGASWSSWEGASFQVAGGLRLAHELALELGPVRVRSVELALDAEEGGVAASATLGVTCRLGPVQLELDRFGVEVEAPLGAGALAAQPRLVVPRRLGLVVDAEAVRGSGELAVSEGCYAGALALTVEGAIGVRAVGVVRTRSPAGEAMFAAKLLGQVDFGGAPLPLGLGFSLLGLGLVVAVDCRMDDAALRQAVGDGSLRALLAGPQAGEAGASAATVALDRFFPEQPGAFVVGLLARLGWGAGLPLVRAELGVFVERDDGVRVALAGTVAAELPDEGAPILSLRGSVLGVVDLAARTMALDASLAGSRVLSWALDGELALRASWGATPGFALSAGGFHPGYAPPPGFPALRRVSLVLGGDNPRLSLAGYFAITESSLQTGARVELVARKQIFLLGTVEVSGHAGFDALVHFHPFSFEVEIYAGCELSLDGDPVLGVDVALTLWGPNPYRVKGTAELEICGIDVSFDFSGQFGAAQPELAPQESALAILCAELDRPENWRVEASAAEADVVWAPHAEAFADPRGAVVFAQRRLPLELAIDHLGNARVSAPRWVGLGAELASEPVEELFCPGEYLGLTDEQRLSSPPFERYRCGLRLGEAEPQLGPGVVVALEARTAIDGAPADDEQRPVCDAAIQVGAQLARRRWAQAPGRVSAAPAEPLSVRGAEYVLVNELGQEQGEAATWAHAHRDAIGVRARARRPA